MRDRRDTCMKCSIIKIHKLNVQVQRAGGVRARWRSTLRDRRGGMFDHARGRGRGICLARKGSWNKVKLPGYPRIDRRERAL